MAGIEAMRFADRAGEAFVGLRRQKQFDMIGLKRRGIDSDGMNAVFSASSTR